MYRNSVEIKNVTKIFPNSSVAALDDLSLSIEGGKITGLIGADGSGKTTLMRIIVGLLNIDKGSVTTLGTNPLINTNILNKKIGYMPQKFGLYEDLSVIENLNFYADLKYIPKDFEMLLEFTNLSKFQNRLAGKLSGGMKQKLGLACALLGSPELLILDEPSVGVDPISRRELMKMVRESVQKHTTVIWSTAYLDEAHSFDTAIVLDKGKIIFDGKPDDLSDTVQGFEERVIELMGGYEERESLIAKDIKLEKSDVKFPVKADCLCKKYGNFYAVRENSFEIKRGEIFGLLGPNGAGKSTSFKMMCGLSTPTSGKAEIMGVDMAKKPIEARSYLGYMAQKFSLYGNLSVRDNLEFYSGAYGLSGKEQSARIEEFIQIFNFEQYINQNASELPLGFKQRLSLACALMHTPHVLFLDEPTSGVDAVTRKEFWDHIMSLAKKGVTVLITTHFMDEAEFCDRISLFYKGRTIAIGTPEELKHKANADNMEEAFINLITESERVMSNENS